MKLDDRTMGRDLPFIDFQRKVDQFEPALSIGGLQIRSNARFCKAEETGKVYQAFASAELALDLIEDLLPKLLGSFDLRLCVAPRSSSSRIGDTQSQRS